MYDYFALHLTFTTVRLILLCVAVTFWMLYFHEVLFRSGRIQTQWLKKGLSDLLLVVSIAIVTFLVFSLVSGFHPVPHRGR